MKKENLFWITIKKNAAVYQENTCPYIDTKFAYAPAGACFYVSDYDKLEDAMELLIDECGEKDGQIWKIFLCPWIQSNGSNP